MGKVRRQRKKLHLEAKSPAKSNPFTPQIDLNAKTSKETESLPEMFIKPQENLFSNVNIDVDVLNKNLSDDTRSVRSLKSVKSETGKVLSKKDKLKMRREMLIKRFEVMAEQKLLIKKKKKDVVGDLNPLKDALPSLESLLKSRGNVPYKQKQPKKKRGVEKSKTIRKNQIQGIKMFQQIWKNKEYKKDPQGAVSQHLKAVLENEKRS